MRQVETAHGTETARNILIEFFNRNKRDVTNPLNNQSIIEFMNQNAQEDPEEPDLGSSENMEIQKIFKPKSSWRPNPPNRALEIFQRSGEQELFKSKPKHNKHNNLTKQERIGLKSINDNPHIVIKKLTEVQR